MLNLMTKLRLSNKDYYEMRLKCKLTNIQNVFFLFSLYNIYHIRLVQKYSNLLRYTTPYIN